MNQERVTVLQDCNLEVTIIINENIKLATFLPTIYYLLDTYNNFLYKLYSQILTQSGVLDKSKYFVNPFVDVSFSLDTFIFCSSIRGGIS